MGLFVRAITLAHGLTICQVAVEVIAHLAGLSGGRVKVTLEIEADMPDGVPEQVVRIVTENSRTLKFDTQGFEEEQCAYSSA